MNKSDLKISPLQEISDDELMKELFARFNEVIFAGLKNKYKGGKTLKRWHYQGDHYACVGLAMMIARICLEDAEMEGEDK